MFIDVYAYTSDLEETEIFLFLFVKYLFYPIE